MSNTKLKTKQQTTTTNLKQITIQTISETKEARIAINNNLKQQLIINQTTKSKPTEPQTSK